MSASVERADEDLPLIQRHAPVHHVAAEKVGSLLRNSGVVGPLRLARRGVEGEHDAPGAGRIDNPILDEWRRLETARAVPSSLLHTRPSVATVRSFDLIEGTEALDRSGRRREGASCRLQAGRPRRSPPGTSLRRRAASTCFDLRPAQGFSPGPNRRPVRRILIIAELNGWQSTTPEAAHPEDGPPGLLLSRTRGTKRMSARRLLTSATRERTSASPSEALAPGPPEHGKRQYPKPPVGARHCHIFRLEPAAALVPDDTRTDGALAPTARPMPAMKCLRAGPPRDA